MYKNFLIVCLIVAGCGEPIPCSADYNEYTDGLCIETNGFPVNMANLSASIGITERRFNSFYPEQPVDLESLFIENYITLEFVEYFWSSIKGVTLGEHHDRETNELKRTSIKVQGNSCLWRNYVTAHEILHVVASYHMNLPELNSLHMVDKMFFIWASNNGLELESALEYYILEDIVPFCNLTMEEVL